jgi:uncharacterized protein HemY
LAAAKEANDDTLGEGNALVYLGRIYTRTDRVADARHTLEKALAIFKQLNDPASQLNAASNLVDVYKQSAHLAAAERRSSRHPLRWI